FTQARDLVRLHGALAVAAKQLEAARLQLNGQRQHRRQLEIELARSEQGAVTAASAAIAIEAPRTSAGTPANELQGLTATLQAKRELPKVTAAEYPSFEFRIKVGRDPALTELYRDAFLASLEPIWGTWFNAAGLTPEQITKFK